MQLIRPKRCNVHAVRPRRACRMCRATTRHAPARARLRSAPGAGRLSISTTARLRPDAAVFLSMPSRSRDHPHQAPSERRRARACRGLRGVALIVVRQPAPHELSYGVRTDGRVLAVRAVPAAVYLGAESSGIFALPGKTLKIEQKIDRVLPSFLSKIDAALGVRSAIFVLPAFRGRARAEGMGGNFRMARDHRRAAVFRHKAIGHYYGRRVPDGHCRRRRPGRP